MDLEPLAAALSADKPCGADLSFSAQFDAIREMRREDDPTLAQGEWVAPLKTADWAGVARACEALLRKDTKDLSVAGWLADAWARLRGFEGLADGLALSALLIEQHWPGLHPQPDGEDQEQRLGCLAWLLGRVKDLCVRIFLVEAGARAYGLADVEVLRQRKPVVQAAAAQAAATEGPPPTLDTVLRAVAGGGRAAFGLRLQAIAGAQAALQRLQFAVETRVPDDGPSFAAARTALEQVAEGWTRLGREAGVADGAPGPAQVPAAPVSSPGAAPDIMLPGVIQSRTQALQQLRLVADYFRHAEPHSPVAYLADKAARWGEMPLHEWLRAVVKDGVALSAFEDLLGVEAREPRE